MPHTGWQGCKNKEIGRNMKKRERKREREISVSLQAIYSNLTASI
jgi:transposase-like protein